VTTPPRPKAASFNAFLESRLRQTRSAALVSNPFALLRILNGQTRGMKIQALIDASQFSFSDFADVLKNLKDAGLVEVTGEPGAELVSLTDSGIAVLGIIG
jgi:predicted transcriptional regulator